MSYCTQQLFTDQAPRPGYVLYWVQSSLFVTNNFCLQRAIEQAQASERPLRIIFIVQPDFPSANTRNMTFLLEGVYAYQAELAKMGLVLEVHLYQSTQLSQMLRAAAILITDTPHTVFQRTRLLPLVEQLQLPTELYESNLCVPAARAYPKRAYSAAVFRRPIWRALDELLTTSPQPFTPCATGVVPYVRASAEPAPLSDLQEAAAVILPQVTAIAPQTLVAGGCLAAAQHFESFLAKDLARYGATPIDLLQPTSRMSAYLHFGQIHPLTLVQACLRQPQTAARDGYLEQLLVRRELAFNYAHYTKESLPSFDFLPDWAVENIQQYQADTRPICYAYTILEQAQTADAAWNAMQRQLLQEGFIHNYLRMYWAKKIIEWTPSFAVALETMQRLNDTYQLDGRDANGYVGMLWNFGLHDRPWARRPIFGRFRYMNANGLRRKTNIDAYIAAYPPTDPTLR